MSGTVYTVASGKGGVGKTTTSVNLAVALWQEGNAVAVVDADIGMANLAAVLGLEPDVTLHDVLAGSASVEEAIVEAQGGNLLVLPGDRSLESFANADPGELRAAVSTLADRSDYVIVDTGAGLSYEDVLPLGMADGVVLVTTPDPAAFGDTRKTMEVADLLGVPVRGLVVTRAAEDTDPEAIAGEIGAELLGTIPEDPAVMAATVAGNPLESHAPKSDAAAAYRDLAATIIGGDQEWLEAHGRERVADATDEAIGAGPDETEGGRADDGAGVEPDEAGGVGAERGAGAADGTAARETETTEEESEMADDESGPAEDETETAAGETWAAANAAPPDDGAESTHLDDLVAEVGEADDASGEDATPGHPAADRAGEDALDETSEPDDAPESVETTGPEAGTVDDDASAEAPTDAESDDDAVGDDADTEADDDDGDEATDDDAGTGDDRGEPDEPASETAEEPEDGEEAEGSAETKEAGGSADADGVEETQEQVTDAEGPDDAEEAGDQEEAEDQEAPEEERGAEETGEPEGTGESADDAAEAESEAEAAEPDETEEPADAEGEETERRGGFFGWLGRLFR